MSVQDIALSVMDCRETATSREDFIDQMKSRGYGVDWQDSHKYITFTDLERQSQGEKQFLISLAVSVYFAELIRAVIPINLLLLLILVHIVYVLIRWYVKGCMRSRGYY